MKKQDVKVNGETHSSPSLTGLKWFGMFVLVVAAIGGFYYFSEYALFLRVIGLLLVVGLIALIAAQTTQGQNALAFFKGAKSEARKVVWPSRQETTQSTMIVLVVVLIAAICLWIIDLILFRLISLLTG